MLRWQLQLRANTTKCLQVRGSRNTGLSPLTLLGRTSISVGTDCKMLLCHSRPSGQQEINTTIIAPCLCLWRRWQDRGIKYWATQCCGDIRSLKYDTNQMHATCKQRGTSYRGVQKQIMYVWVFSDNTARPKWRKQPCLDMTSVYLSVSMSHSIV